MKTKRFLASAIAVILVFSLATTSFARLKGDVNNDGAINSSDALAVLLYAVGAESEIEMNVADMNSDGNINSSDALAILRISVGMDQAEEIPEEPEIPDDAPKTTEEIVALYNDAINKVVNEKAGYTKERTTTVSEMNGGALMKIQLVVDMVNDFLGVGTKEYTNPKGKSEYLLNASLTADDVKSATCEENGDSYTVTLVLNNGNSSATSSSKKDNSPIARSGLLTGSVASPDYDYLSSGCVYASISGVDNVSVKSIKATNSNVKLVAVVDTEGKLISMTASYDWTVEMANVKYMVVSVKEADGKAHTAVELSDFKW